VRALRSRAALALLALMLLALAAPWLAPFGPEVQPDPVGGASLAPSLAHPFGTDSYSRDVLSRMLHGARVSLGIAVLAVAVALSLGTAVGAAAAILGGWYDALLMRLTDVAFAVPRLLLLLVVAAGFGAPSPAALALLIGVTGWMTTARLVRQETRRLLATEHLRAARALGVPRARLLRVHLLPGLLPTLAAAGSIALAAAVPLEAGLSFLGLGVQPPDASWGNIIQDADARVLRHWWLVVFPTLAIAGTVLAANVLAERFSADASRTP
jgi:peptide/nickel transport system permease protein